ncbi:MAG: M24 family metallopeptidase [Salinibacter sp.]|uniref:M24 family metallopeptidase n=1 Tax=Salinibacter sp. TaxID=2065818 RepID=UPI0035D4C0B8
MANRLSKARKRLEDLDADALYLTSLPDIRWTCGFTGSNGILIVGPDASHFVTDGRYTEQARSEVEGATVHIAQDGLSKHIAEEELLDRFSEVAFQAESVSVATREKLADTHDSVQWTPVFEVLTPLVASKEEYEVQRIRAAQSITESVFDDLPALLEPGMTEREVGAEIVYRHLKQGADSMSFDPIVASGPNAARPHARPTDRPLREGDLVVVDMGCYRQGYASDMTRTLAVGTPSSAAQEGYEVVLQAQEAALSAARAGMTGKELDGLARDVLEEAGFGEAFSHGLGHGIGLEVHEWPRVSHSVDHELPEGTCVTIEPGIYVPEENFGVRIEDIVVLRPDGCDNLTHASKELLVI